MSFVPGRIRDKFPPPKKTVTVRVRVDLYREVMNELKSSKNSFVDFLEASMKAFLEESEMNMGNGLKKKDNS